jgi:dienelactone hydrolase
VPESAYNDQSAPILLRNYIGGYMPSLPQTPNAADASGRALKEGYVLVIPGARGNTTTSPDGATNVGKAPAAIVDLKAAVRYLRHNDGVMPGDAEKIISDGTSAGGAMSALLGASGNNKLYELYLTAIGAANERDDIFAAVCFCPITDLDHSDTAYEWLYNRLNDEALYQFTDAQKALSAELAALYPAYIDSLALLTASGAPFNAANYDGYIKLLLIQSAQTALDTGAVSAGELAKNEWITLSGNTVTDLDYEAYLSSVGRMTPTKNPSAFDNLGVNVADDSSHRAGSRENQVFGTETADALNFTDWSLNKAAGAGGAGTALDQSVRDRVYLMNPMNFIPDAATATAPNWYIRHGARDRDTAFPIPINLAALLAGNGYAVDFSLPWDRPHSGDYELDELFAWIKGVTGKL